MQSQPTYHSYQWRHYESESLHKSECYNIIPCVFLGSFNLSTVIVFRSLFYLWTHCEYAGTNKGNIYDLPREGRSRRWHFREDLLLFSQPLGRRQRIWDPETCNKDLRVNLYNIFSKLHHKIIWELTSRPAFIQHKFSINTLVTWPGL